MKHISRMLDRELKKGSAELLILALVEARARHGYEISKLIEERSGGRLRFKVASLYPLLYRLEERGWIKGTWMEKAGERRRRFYRITRAGRQVLAVQKNPAREKEILDEFSQHLDDRFRELRSEGKSEHEAMRLAIAEIDDPDLE